MPLDHSLSRSFAKRKIRSMCMATARTIATALLLLGSGQAYAQPFPIFNGMDYTCVGAFLDSGGQGAVGYSNNENITYTICPDSPGDAITLNFLTFNLSTAGAAPIDNMTIYDGNSVAATSLGNYTGNALAGVTVSASPLNTSGCLTIVFRSNNTGVGVFAATISCYTPCDRPTAVAGFGGGIPLRICPGESVNFNGSGSFAAPGFSIANWSWNFGDGAVVNNGGPLISHTYNTPGAYTAQLYLTDNNGCASTNLVDLQVLVGTEPVFTGTTGTLLGCEGETLCLNGVVTGTTWNELPGSNLGGGVFLPDNVGQCFESHITFNQFAPGQTLNNIADLLSICMDIEHSFLGDLIIRIISPTGEAVTMHQQGGGGTYLGVPVDNDLTPNIPGTCWNYCISPTAANGTMAANAAGTLPAGTYASVNSLAGLLGSQLNGTWTLQICDMWASDNGFLCNWGLDFNPALFPDLIEFTPIYGAACDSSSWSGPFISSTSANCNGVCVSPPQGSHNYQFTVTDDFGCSYDTTLTVTIIPGPQVNAGPDATTCNTPVQLGATVGSGGFPTNCTYVLTLYDSFGDGWTGLFGLGSNGSNVTITVNGVSNSYWLTNGSQASVNIPVTSGSTISLSYTTASLYNGEQAFTLFNGSGGVVYASPYGPGGGLAWSGVANCPGGNFVYSWSPTTGLSNPNIANPVATVSGTTTYCVTVYQEGHPDCTTTDCMTITVDDTVDAGTNGSLLVCSDAAAVNLIAQLGGAPTAGGTWTAPGGGAHTGVFMPGSDPAGIYTYTVSGSGACGSATASSTVNVVMSPLPDAGISTSLSVCSNDAIQALFPLLGGSPMAGGIWTAPGGGAFGGTFNPALHAAGTYTYTVPGAAPCPNASATVAITMSDPPNAGTNNSITLCSNSAPLVLITQLGGSPDGTGSWTDPSGASISGGIDPSTAAAGNYTYTVNGTSPCPNATAILTVNINTPPDPGTDGAITLCTSDAGIALIDQLGGSPDAGGAWSGPSTVVGGLFDPASMNAGVYTYTVAGTAPCPSESANVQVSLNTPPNAGSDGSTTLCSTDAAIGLFALLGGAPDSGGAWSGPSAIAGDQFDPASMNAGVYTYTVNGVAPCPSDVAAITVNINTPPDPGTDGAITLCTSDAGIALFDQLGGTPDAGGTWSGPSTVVGGLFNPASMNAGVYTYTVAGATPCPSESANVQVSLNTPPNAGIDGSTTLCSTDAAIGLFALLGGAPDSGGAWSGPSAIAGDQFDPASMNAGVYTYTVNGVAPCPSDVAAITVNINTPPDPGTDGAITLCTSDAGIALIDQLGGTPDAGGTWSGPSTVIGGLFDPASMNAGVYTYTVAGTAPCPSESANVQVSLNTPPNAGIDGSTTLCSTDAAIGLFALLGGAPDAGGAWSGPSAIAGDQFDPANMNAGVYTYTVNGVAPCPSDVAAITVNINTPPDPGTDGVITLCTSDAGIALFDQLGGSPDAGGAWSGPSTVVGGLFDPASMNAGVYTYTVAGTAPCPSESANVQVSLNTPPNAGIDGSTTLCSTDAAIGLFALLGGAPDAGGAWSGPSAIAGDQFDPANMSAGVYTYTVAGVVPCPSDVAAITVNINTPPDPGTDGAITLCISDAGVALFDQLGGTPDAGGTWSGPSTVVGGLFNPASMNAGVYTYTVAGTAPCPSESASVQVSLNTPPNAGIDGSTTLCSTDAAIGLFALLGGAPDAGGAWSGPSAIAGDQFDPANMNAGVYTYTVNGVAPCPSDVAAITVVVNTPPNAGINGGLTLCSSSPTTGLFSGLNGTPDAGGTWTTASGVAHSGNFTPGTDQTGVYTYTVQGASPCPATSATVDVAVVTNPDAGTPGNITLCTTDASILLFDQLGGTPDAGGAWSGPSAVVGGVFNPASMNAGVYTYTITVPPPCVNASSTVTVALVQPPNAGNNGALTLCISSPATALSSGLGGSPNAGGTWSGPSPVVGGLFNPASMNAGDYTYTVAGTTPCPADVATVSVTVVSAPDAGTPGNITLCTTDASILLFDQLGGTPDAGGAWSGPSAVVGGVFNPASMNAGVYTYTITVPPPCVNASSTVTVALVQPPNAGNNGALTLCISSPATALSSGLGGTPNAGGTWSGPSTVVGGLFNPASMNVGDYTYTVAGTTPCPADVATVSVTVVSAPDAGTPGNIALCTTDASILLFDQLGGTPDAGGAWSGPSAVVGGVFNPASMNAGVYTYTITVPPPCVNASSTVIVALVQPPNAGNNGALTLCISSPATALSSGLGGTPNAGGTWSGPSTVVGGLFNPASMNAGDYTYTVAGTTPCPADVAMVSVTVVSAPDAGTPGNITLCTTDASILLFDQLGGTPDAGGAWSGPSAVVGGVFNPASMNAGVYTYTITVPPPCVNASSTVTVALVQPPNAGNDGALTLCISSPATALSSGLGGTPNAGGTWSGPSPVVGGLFNPASMNAGDYTYTVAGTTPCPADVATVSVTVVDEPNAGGPGFLTLCTSDASQDLFSSLEGSPDQGGQWTMPNGALFSGVFEPSSHSAGTYTYTISVPPPCQSVSATVEVSLSTPPNAGTDGALTACISGSAVELFASLNGTPDAGGTWNAPNGSAFTGIFDPQTDVVGSYSYTVAGTTPCPAASASVVVSVSLLPFPGNNAVLNLCSSGDAQDLFPSLGGADAGGSWSGPGGIAFAGIFTPGQSTPGNHTYTVPGTAPCPSASAVITVNVLSDAYAGEDGSRTLCSINGPIQLFGELNGSPDAGGIWLGPGGNVVAGVFDPASDAAGTYTYVLVVPAPCVNDTALVQIDVVQAVDAGTDAQLTLCSNGNSIDLLSQLGGSPNSSGTWNGPGGFLGTSFTPGTNAPGNYTYTVIGTAPCPNASATLAIAVNPLPNAGENGSISLCPEAASVDLFSVLGGSPESGGQWTTPNGTASNGIFNPGTDAVGNYTYTVSGLLPCPNVSASATVSVYMVPVPNAGPDAVSCTLEYALNATGTWSSGTWSGPVGAVYSDPNDPQTGVSMSQGGTYTFTWSTTSANGCSSSDAVSITFTDAILPVLTGTDAICHGACNGTASVATTGGNTVNGNYTYQWSGGVAGNSPTATGLCAGSYTVTVFDMNGCSAEASVLIDQPEPLVIDAITAVNETCPGSCDGSIAVSDVAAVLYSINGGISFQAGGNFGGLCPGSYSIVIQDANGCTASGSGTVGSPAPVVAGFTWSPDPIYVSEPTVQFNNSSTFNATNFSWNFDGLGSSSATSPAFTFPGVLGDDYLVCLTASDANGCSNTYCVRIEVLDVLGVFVPNAFTPDGDGINDLFHPVFNLPDVADYEFMIFDRWGALFFSSNVPGVGWNGTFSGEASPVDVYVWKLRYRDPRSTERKDVVGHVTLVR